MASSGIRRKVDDLGRVVIPSSIRKTLGITEGDLLEIHLDGDRIVLSSPDDACTFCGSSLHLDSFRGKAVCWSCTAALRAKDRARDPTPPPPAPEAPPGSEPPPGPG